MGGFIKEKSGFLHAGERILMPFSNKAACLSVGPSVAGNGIYTHSCLTESWAAGYLRTDTNRTPGRVRIAISNGAHPERRGRN